MNCDEAIELLPWLLNGTLEEGERREVRHHLETCERCRAAWAETWEAAEIFGQHLPSEALVALAYGEAPAGIDPALAERHLASCPECSAELELARTSRRLEEDDKIAVFPAPKVRDRGEPRSWRAAAIAASLAGVVAASGWIHSAQELRTARLEERPSVSAVEPGPPAPAAPSGDAAVARQLEEANARSEKAEKDKSAFKEQLDRAQTEVAELRSQLRRPAGIELNLWTGLVQPAAERSGSAGEVVMPAGRPALLTLAPEGPDTPRKVEIRNEASELVLEGRLTQNPDLGQYTISFNSTALKPGSYTIQLYSLDGEKRETYRLRVE